MGNIKRTIAYFKRNGLTDTWYAVRERTDVRHMDDLSIFMKKYKGRIPLTEREKKRQQETVFGEKYTFSVIVPTYETAPAYFRQMVDSVLAQTYPVFELIIADASASDVVSKEAAAYKDPRVCYHRLTANGGISVNTNAALALAKGDYIALLDHDDVLEPDALFCMMEKLQEKEYAFLYSDEDKTDSDMEYYYEPHIKPEFNFDLLLSNNYICHFLVMKAELIKTLGFRKEMDGAQDYDLVLRAVEYLLNRKNGQNGDRTETMRSMHKIFRQQIGHVPQILYHWRCHAASTADNPESKRYAYEAGLAALSGFTRRLGWEVGTGHSRHLGFYTIDYRGHFWQTRPDVAAIGGNCIAQSSFTPYAKRILKRTGTLFGQRGIIADSPILDGKKMFVGLRQCYSGYMHRAALRVDVQQLLKDYSVWRPGLDISCAKAREKGMCLLYAPDWESLAGGKREDDRE